MIDNLAKIIKQGHRSSALDTGGIEGGKVQVGHCSQECGQPRMARRTGCLGTEAKESGVKESKEGLSVGQRKRNPSLIL